MTVFRPCVVFYDSHIANNNLFDYLRKNLLSFIGDVPQDYIDVSESSNNPKVIKYRINIETVPTFVIERDPRPLEIFNNVNDYLERIIEIYKGKSASNEFWQIHP